MRSRIEELREEIDELYKEWDPVGLSAEEFHRLDDPVRGKPRPSGRGRIAQGASAPPVLLRVVLQHLLD